MIRSVKTVTGIPIRVMEQERIRIFRRRATQHALNLQVLVGKGIDQAEHNNSVLCRS